MTPPLISLPPSIVDDERMRLTISVVIESEWKPKQVLVHFWGSDEPVVLKPKRKERSSFEATLKVSVVTSVKHFEAYLRDSKDIVFDVVKDTGRVLTSSLPALDLVNESTDISPLQYKLPLVDGQSFKETHDAKMTIVVSLNNDVQSNTRDVKGNNASNTHDENVGKGSSAKQREERKENKCVLVKEMPSSPFRNATRRVKFNNESPRLITSSKRGRDVTTVLKIKPQHSQERKAASTCTNEKSPQSVEDGGSHGVLREDNDVTCTTEDTFESDEKELPHAKKSADQRQALQPTWNLSTRQLQYLSSITHFSIDLRAASLKNKVYELLVTNRSKLTGARGSPNNSKLQCKGGLPLKVGPTMFFFVSYALPDREDDFITACSRKVHKEGNKSLIVFNHKCLQSVTFSPQLLDKYYTATLIIRLHCRALNQQRPTLLGQASLAMKHLLMSDTSEGGLNVLKLPIFASENIKRALDKNATEILGDFEASFKFVKESRRGKVTSGNKAKNGHGNIVGGNAGVNDNERRKKDEPGMRSESSSVKDDVTTGIGSKLSSISEQERHQDLYRASKEDQDIVCEEAQVLLRVPSGRNFALDHSTAPSLFVSVRMFDPSEKTTSSVSWHNTSPNFGMQIVTWVSLSRDFVMGLEDNFVVVEVWRVGEPKNEIVGISMLSLQQFFLGLKTEERAERSLSEGSAAMIAVDDWVSVQSLNTGQAVGEISCLLALGSENQICALLSSRHSLKSSVSELSQSSKRKEKSVKKNYEKKLDECYHPQSFVATEVNVLEGRNLPNVFDVQAQKRVLPSSYVTFQTDNERTQVSSLILQSRHPKWGLTTLCGLKSHLYWDPNTFFILKIWHHSVNNKQNCVDMENDAVIGFVAIDLGLLIRGNFDALKGWFNVMDYLGRCKGQVKVCIKALDDIEHLKVVHKQACIERKESTVSDLYRCADDEDDGNEDSHGTDNDDRTSSIDCIRAFEWPTSDKSSNCATDIAKPSKSETSNLVIDETVTRSLLDRKIRDLTTTTNSMKKRLKQSGQRPQSKTKYPSSSSSSSQSRGEDERPFSRDDDEESIVLAPGKTFSELQEDIVRQLSRMRELNQRTWVTKSRNYDKNYQNESKENQAESEMIEAVDSIEDNMSSKRQDAIEDTDNTLTNLSS